MAEELATHLPLRELVTYYSMAESELVNSRNPEILNRLAKCARLLLSTQSFSDSEVVDQLGSEAKANKLSTTPDSTEQLVTDFALGASLDEQVLRYEGELIKQALEAAEGSITRAARMLGVTHQGLAFILNGRQKSLLPARKPAKPRRRSIIRYH